ncbi:MAG: hypothetical protein ACXAEX_20030 [Promethearchaeota archaeon]
MPRGVKLGEFNALDTTQLLKILIEKFPECEFKVSRGRTIEFFSLISSCDKESIHKLISDYFEHKSKIISSKKALEIPLYSYNDIEESVTL